MSHSQHVRQLKAGYLNFDHRALETDDTELDKSRTMWYRAHET